MNDSAEPRQNLASLLDDLAARPWAPAFVRRTAYRRFCWTAGETRTAALALCGRLARAGVSPGDRVLLQGPDGPEWVAAFLGIAAAGAIAVPLDATSPPPFARTVAAKTSARAAIVPFESAGTLTDIVATLEPLERVATLRTISGPQPEPYRARPDETAEIVFTSGTTAEPKGVELTHANLLASLAGIEAGFRKRRWALGPLLPFRFLCLVPLSHLFGQSLGIAIPILMRSTAVFSASLQPARLLSILRKEGPLAVITVPRVLASLRDAVLREIDRRGERAAWERVNARCRDRSFVRRVLASRRIRALTGWRTFVVVVGGAALDPDLEAFWSGCGFLVVEGYGMTEAAPIISVHNPLDRTSRTLGRPLRNLEVRLAEDGEVLVRGPNVMKGYYRDPGATAEAIRDGWLRTGDLAERDAEGRLFFKGRKKDLIVLPGGLNVHASDVERALLALPVVREGVVFAARGEDGDEVHAAVLAGTGGADAEAIRAAANATLLPHQRIRRLVVWEDPDFPRTSTGKARRGEIAATARILTAAGERGRLAPGSAPASLRRIAAAVARVRPDLGRISDPATRLVEDLGLESLDVLEVLSVLEEEHGIDVQDPEASRSLTAGGLEQILDGSPERVESRIRMPRWGRSGPLRALRAVARPLLLRPLYAIFVRLEVRGREHVRASRGPFLVVANHASVLDAPTVVFALPRALRGRVVPAMAVEALPEHFDSRGRPLGRRIRSAALYGIAAGLFGAYPMPQTRAFRPSLEYSGELVDAGLSPLVFPEGRMVIGGAMESFRPGIGLLATQIRVPVLPVLLEGLDSILPPGARWPRRGRARATIGPPLELFPQNDETPLAVARRIEAAVRALAEKNRARDGATTGRRTGVHGRDGSR